MMDLVEFLIQTIKTPESTVQSGRLPLQSSELAPPAPSHTSECCPPLVPGGRHTRLRERERGESQFGRRDRHSGTLGIV